MIEHLENLLADGRDDLLLRFGLANGHFREGNLEAAVEHARRALVHDPAHSASWVLLARALVRLERWDEARNAVDSGLPATREQGDRQAERTLEGLAGKIARAQR